MSQTPKPTEVFSEPPPREAPEELREGSVEIHVDPDLEKSSISKFDRYMLPQLGLLVLLAYLDRSNIGMCFSRYFFSYER